MNLQQFKQRMKLRIIALLSLAGVLTIVFLCMLYFVTPQLSEYLRGFQFGAFGSLVLLLCASALHSCFILRNENRLRKQFIKETDERTLFIHQKTGSLGIAICGVGLCSAAIVANFFNTIIFATLLSAAGFLVVVKLGLKAYYQNKY